MSPTSDAHHVLPDDVAVTLRGPVHEEMADRARDQVAHATRFSDRNVLSATVTLTQQTNPARPDASRAEVAVDIAGTPVRAEMDAPTPEEALDGAVSRLERRITDHVNRWDDRSRFLQTPHDGWRHGDVPSDRPSHFPRPVEEREIVRRKTFAVEHSTVEEAAFDMESLGHDFHLFTDATTGSPAVVRRRTDGSYAVAGLSSDAVVPETVTVEPPPPTIDEATARQRLDDGQEPFVFYIDEATTEGAIVYRRYDGHYGLITID